MMLVDVFIIAREDQRRTADAPRGSGKGRNLGERADVGHTIGLSYKSAAQSVRQQFAPLQQGAREQGKRPDVDGLDRERQEDRRGVGAGRAGLEQR